MKKNSLLSLALLAAVAPLANATPSWLQIFKLGREISHSADDVRDMFACPISKIDMEKLFSANKSNIAQAQKIASQMKTAKALISWQAMNNNFLKTRIFGHALLSAGKVFAVPYLLMTASGAYDETVAATGALAGMALSFKPFSRALDRHFIGKELHKKHLEQIKDEVHRLESDFKSQLPEYLKGQGFPEKAIKATMSMVNKPSFVQNMKQAAFKAIKR
jgi:hypothetical protein